MAYLHSIPQECLPVIPQAQQGHEQWLLQPLCLSKQKRQNFDIVFIEGFPCLFSLFYKTYFLQTSGEMK